MSLSDRVEASFRVVRDRLLAERNDQGWWTGQLSTSALSTATAVVALETVRKQNPEWGKNTDFRSLIDRGIAWLAGHQNCDGGWGDTVKSFSNISTTMLCHAAFVATMRDAKHPHVVDRAQSYIDNAGGVAALAARYGDDKTFSVPILTQCALAGTVEWSKVPQLPFEYARMPHGFYKMINLRVVSYALPALIAIGQVRHFHRPTRNPLTRFLRNRAVKPTLRKLEDLQPDSGGFLEATPLTSFVTMSLAGMGQIDHSVCAEGCRFIVDSVLDDGSWPIDTNLATWVTTLSIKALGEELPGEERKPIVDWLLFQQYQEEHPYTRAAPGGWSWTDLSGGVPDADDTPGAILALLEFEESVDRWKLESSLRAGVRWVLDLQNKDGGWPTFCRGWGKLEFDRSAPDISAHVMRALHAWLESPYSQSAASSRIRAESALETGFAYLENTQRDDGSWLPLWFGNQHAPDDENRTYGTVRVLEFFRATGRFEHQSARKALSWLRESQNSDGGWGGRKGTPSTIEETSLAVDVLFSADGETSTVRSGLNWLMDRVEGGTYAETAPIGFYFAKLWYFERLYPLTFLAQALRTVRDGLVSDPSRPPAEMTVPEKEEATVA